MRNKLYIGFVLGCIISVLCFLAIPLLSNDHKTTSLVSNIKNTLQIHPTSYPLELSFADENIANKDLEVMERIDREMIVNHYMQGTTMLYLKLANRWFPIIEPILKSNGIPDDFKYLCVAESGLQPVVSPSKAEGFWQFLSETGRQYGLTINDDVDERYNVEKATQAACDYLNAAYQKFGSWTLAAASYNCGMGCVNSRITEQQQSNYFEMVFPRETMRYVFRIIALKHIMSHPAEYGFNLEASDYYQPLQFSTEYINTSINWIDYARSKNISYKDLRYYNPWIRNETLSNSYGKTYEVKVPIE